jgi:hypothetical protein
MSEQGVVPRTPEDPPGSFPLRVRRALDMVSTILNDLIRQGILYQKQGSKGPIWTISLDHLNILTGPVSLSDEGGMEGFLLPPGTPAGAGPIAQTAAINQWIDSSDITEDGWAVPGPPGPQGGSWTIHEHPELPILDQHDSTAGDQLHRIQQCHAIACNGGVGQSHDIQQQRRHGDFEQCAGG